MGLCSRFLRLILTVFLCGLAGYGVEMLGSIEWEIWMSTGVSKEAAPRPLSPGPA